MAETDEELFLIIARRKANFKRGMLYYIAFNAAMWTIWWFTTGHITGFNGYPWPAWLMLGWGVALLKQYFQAYHSSKRA